MSDHQHRRNDLDAVVHGVGDDTNPQNRPQPQGQQHGIMRHCSRVELAELFR